MRKLILVLGFLAAVPVWSQTAEPPLGGSIIVVQRAASDGVIFEARRFSIEDMRGAKITSVNWLVVSCNATTCTEKVSTVTSGRIKIVPKAGILYRLMATVENLSADSIYQH